MIHIKRKTSIALIEAYAPRWRLLTNILKNKVYKIIQKHAILLLTSRHGDGKMYSTVRNKPQFNHDQGEAK